MPAEANQTIESLYNLLRALVFKFGCDVTLTKAEFMESLGAPLSIQHVPQDEVTYLRIWQAPKDKENGEQRGYREVKEGDLSRVAANPR